MERYRSISIRWLRGGVAHASFPQFSREDGWAPAINAYRCNGCVRVCFDLAGVAMSEIEIRVEPRRLTIRGSRRPPEPCGEEPRPVQILAMEIDYGPFVRELALPVEVDPERSAADQKNGLLWINMPLAEKP